MLLPVGLHILAGANRPAVGTHAPTAGAVRMPILAVGVVGTPTPAVGASSLPGELQTALPQGHTLPALQQPLSLPGVQLQEGNKHAAHSEHGR